MECHALGGLTINKDKADRARLSQLRLADCQRYDEALQPLTEFVDNEGQKHQSVKLVQRARAPNFSDGHIMAVLKGTHTALRPV